MAKQKKSGTSKLLERFKGLKTVEQLQQEHMMERIKFGLRELLQMHVPQELSSIIGVLAGEEGVLGHQGGIMKKEPSKAKLAPILRAPVQKGPDGLPVRAPVHDPNKKGVTIRKPAVGLVSPKVKPYVPPPVVLLVQQTGKRSIEMLINWTIGDPLHPKAGTTVENEALDVSCFHCCVFGMFCVPHGIPHCCCYMCRCDSRDC